MELRQENKDNDKNKEIYKYKFPKINQIKIVRNTENGKSKKFGFVEFREHSDSLLVLRALNNKEIESIDTTLHIEFAIENQKKLHIHKLKIAKYKNKTSK